MADVYTNLLRGGYFPVGRETDAYSIDDTQLPEASAVFKYLFSKYSSFLNSYRKVPPAHVYERIEQLTGPFFGEYAETTDNPHFLEIATKFFKALFWNECVYVTFEDINEVINKALIDMPSDQIEELLADIQLPEGKSFQLWFKQGLDEDGAMCFMHLETELTMKRPDWKKLMIKVTWDGDDVNNRFRHWYLCVYQMILDEHSLNTLKSLCTKRMDLITKSHDTTSYNSAVASVYNGNPFFERQETYLVNPASYIDPSEYKEYQTAIHLHWDRSLSELGRVANTNPKMERLTTGENYKDIVAVANRQRMTLNQLKRFAQKVYEKWGQVLAFAINGIPQRIPLEGDIEVADVPVDSLSRG